MNKEKSRVVSDFAIRKGIWKQWKKPKTKKGNLLKLGIPEYFASQAANSRKKYWYVSDRGTVNKMIIEYFTQT